MSLSGLATLAAATLAAATLAAASAPPPPNPDPPARRLWLVTSPGGERFSASCTPPATLLELSGWYPGAIIEPEYEPEPDPFNPKGGMGHCEIDAPASLKPCALWPTGAVECPDLTI